MPQKENKGALLVIPAAMAILLAFFGIFKHATWWMWALSGAVYLAGDYYESWQYRKDGDTTLLPYVLQFIAAALMGVLAFSS